MRPPNQIDLNGTWEGINVNVLLITRVEHGKPHFYLAEINHFPLWIIGDNISNGVNAGIDEAFQKAPIDIAEITMDDSGIGFLVIPSGRAPLPTPSPTTTSTPTPMPTATNTPTAVGVTTLALFNDLGEDIILEIGDRQWELDANDSKVVEIPPGTYPYKMIFKESGKVGSRGTKTWTVMTYKWHINLANQ